ncbi:MAG: DUF1571 domain-containing protein [Pirellulaceae bacterium]
MAKNIAGSLTRSLVVVTLLVGGSSVTCAQQQTSDKPTTEPVYRVANDDDAQTTLASSTTTEPVAPIDRALDIARDGLAHIRADVRDYTATMIKRERINGAVNDAEFMKLKVRSRNEAEGIPLSVYMRFLKPAAFKGREVIWVEGRNNGKLTAHEGSGVLSGIVANLDPDGMMAMRGNRYPIYEAGIENLVFRLIEKGERDKSMGEAVVQFYEQTKINGRECTLIQVTHAEQRPGYDFHICRIFIDKEMQVPIRYAAYGWPLEPGGKPTLEEEYTYLNLDLNVGLTDEDFDINNSEYDFR